MVFAGPPVSTDCHNLELMMFTSDWQATWQMDENRGGPWRRGVRGLGSRILHWRGWAIGRVGAKGMSELGSQVGWAASHLFLGWMSRPTIYSPMSRPGRHWGLWVTCWKEHHNGFIPTDKRPAHSSISWVGRQTDKLTNYYYYTILYTLIFQE